MLQAIGFTPRTSGYGLKATGIQPTAEGAIAVDQHCRTSVEHIYAVGDVTARLMLAHVADTMGMVAAETIAGASTITLTEDDYVRMPRATFSQPQVASFGLTESQARERGLSFTVARFPFSANGKAPGIGETAGFVKLISAQPWES